MAECLNEYIPTIWVNGTAPAINAVNLNHIENGLRDVTECTRELEEKINNVGSPIGTIVMFNGTLIPEDWSICDGTNGTPDLINKFIRAGATSGATGGSDDAVNVSHGHTFTGHALPPHTHTLLQATQEPGPSLAIIDFFSTNIIETPKISSVSAGTPSGTVSNSGVSGVGKNVPAYYTLMYIMKVT